MNITWYGQSCFKIEVQRKKDDSVAIITDPFLNEIGIRAPKLEADVFLISSFDSKEKFGNGLTVSGPGEYDVKGVSINGLPEQTRILGKKPASSKTTIFIIQAEDMRICYLSNLGQAELAAKDVEEIGEVDILLIPVGGGQVLDEKEALKIMSQIEPKITVPMYYKVPGLKVDLEPLDKFLKVLGIKSLEPLPKLSIKQKDLPADEAKVIILQP